MRLFGGAGKKHLRNQGLALEGDHEKHIKKVLRNVNSSDGGTEMSDLNKEEYMDTEEVEAQDAEMEEKAMGLPVLKIVALQV